ncbi:hypothetical protein Ctha_1477 [Chloroherpeton thalassium ATCC 35110]|uniref:Uncharacterized protein n=1 Tax=Chloroherpeton thalassium (strain ATCC 35110 / GB-78) TaxID=517418 RepID=B3QRY3_CHLT3|nr:hypothetical protein [Chloroherpeton thalassium]ACF13936.1 hypothetical protein Ctha_1477 [Chloroherpeton thalassium ATCC 35110]
MKQALIICCLFTFLFPFKVEVSDKKPSKWAEAVKEKSLAIEFLISRYAQLNRQIDFYEKKVEMLRGKLSHTIQAIRLYKDHFTSSDLKVNLSAIRVFNLVKYELNFTLKKLQHLKQSYQQLEWQLADEQNKRMQISSYGSR